MISANIPNETRRTVYRRDGFACALCGDVDGLQAHHVIHRSCGGSNYPMNLITLCWRCHAAAHGTRIAERPAYLKPEDYEQACVEYLADHYAEQGIIWSPWEKK